MALLKDEMKSLQAQMADFQREIASRQRDREYLTYFREKCAELVSRKLTPSLMVVPERTLNSWWPSTGNGTPAGTAADAGRNRVP